MIIKLDETQSIAFNGILVASQSREAEVTRLRQINLNQIRKFAKVLGYEVMDNCTVTVLASDSDGYPTEINLPTLPTMNELKGIMEGGPNGLLRSESD